MKREVIMKRLSLIFLMLTACGRVGEVEDFLKSKDYVDKRAPFVEEVFKVHVNTFKFYYKTDFNILMEFKVLDGMTMATCKSWSDGYREIAVDPVKWIGLSFNGQEQLLFHELGHCIFNLDHVETKMKKGNWINIPTSIMYPYVFGDTDYYKEFKDHYFQEMKP